MFGCPTMTERRATPWSLWTSRRSCSCRLGAVRGARGRLLPPGPAIASNPFFVSAAGSSALVTKIDDATEFGAGATLSTTAALFETRGPEDDPHLSYPPRDRVLRRELAGIPHLAQPVFTMMSPSVAAGASPTAEDPVEVRLLRTDALQHVRKLDQASDEGVWMPATTAKSSVSRQETFAVGLGTAARTIRCRSREPTERCAWSR